jgi:hypothetical protein
MGGRFAATYAIIIVLSGAAGTFAHWGAWGCAMMVLVCVICGFTKLFTAKYAKGAKI